LGRGILSSGAPTLDPEEEDMEQHTVEVAFEGELVSSVYGESGILTLYRTPEDNYFVHIDTRQVGEEAARVVGRNAVLDDGHAGLGHSESFARHFWPELFAAQSAK
jgi:hypothetical protein